MTKVKIHPVRSSRRPSSETGSLCAENVSVLGWKEVRVTTTPATQIRSILERRESSWFLYDTLVMLMLKHIVWHVCVLHEHLEKTKMMMTIINK